MSVSFQIAALFYFSDNIGNLTSSVVNILFDPEFHVIYFCEDSSTVSWEIIRA